MPERAIKTPHCGRKKRLCLRCARWLLRVLWDASPYPLTKPFKKAVAQIRKIQKANEGGRMSNATKAKRSRR